MNIKKLLLTLTIATTVANPLSAATLAGFHFETPMTTSTFTDITGNGHHAVFNRNVTTSTNTPFSTGYSLALSTNSTVARLSNADQIDIRNGEGNGSFTIEGWINPSEVGHMVFIAMTTQDGRNTIQLAINSTGLPEARFRTDNRPFVRATSDQVVEIGEWVHLALVYNQQESEVTLFVNANKVSTESIPYVGLPDHFNTIAFGGDGTNQVKGLIADLRFSDIALPASQLGFHAPIPEPSTAMVSLLGGLSLWLVRGKRAL